MATSTFGERLKREREMRGVSLEEISTATRIGTRFLEALENEQWDRLPGGVFNRGFVRAVARFLGLDEEDMVGEYDLATNNQREVAVWAAKPSPLPERNWRPLLVVTIGIVLVGAGWLAWRQFGARLIQSAGPGSATGHSTTTAAPPVTLAAPDASAATNETMPLDLKVGAGKTVQVTILADSKKVFEGQMKPNENLTFRAQDAFEITASNSTALVIELNGQVQLLPALPEQPGSIRLTRESLKKNPGGGD